MFLFKSMKSGAVLSLTGVVLMFVGGCASSGTVRKTDAINIKARAGLHPLSIVQIGMGEKVAANHLRFILSGVVKKSASPPTLQNIPTTAAVQWRLNYEMEVPGGIGRIYELNVEFRSPADRATFTTLDFEWAGQKDSRKLAPLAPGSSVAFYSCSHDSDSQMSTAETFAAGLETAGLSQVFAIGDAVYTDVERNQKSFKPQPASKGALFRRTLEARRGLPQFHREILIPTSGLWDDHDFGMDNGNRHYPAREESEKIFRAAWGIGDDREADEIGPGLSRMKVVGGVPYLLLDNRTFRDEKSERGTHLGRENLEWIKKILRRLKDQKKDVAVMMTGDPFFGGYFLGDMGLVESYEGDHPAEFASFQRQLRQLYLKNRIPRFILVSGDRHYAEWQIIEKSAFGFSTFEFTTSPAHAYAPAESLPAAHENPRRIFAAFEKPNFLVLRFNPGKVGFEAESHDSAGGKLQEKFFSF